MKKRNKLPQISHVRQNQANNTEPKCIKPTATDKGQPNAPVSLKSITHSFQILQINLSSIAIFKVKASSGYASEILGAKSSKEKGGELHHIKA